MKPVPELPCIVHVGPMPYRPDCVTGVWWQGDNGELVMQTNVCPVQGELAGW